MSRFCSLFSSSSGNCTYIGTASSGILIDAGVSAKRITEALSDRNIAPESIKAIFVTHEHSDHIKGIKVFASRHHTPVFATEGTVLGMDKAGVLTDKFTHDVVPMSGIEVGGMFVRRFPTPHDCNESCGYTVEMPDGRKIAVATDIGHMTNEIMNSISGCDLVMIESNHDVGMLQNGIYPYYLKRRILSDVGHLCNEDCAEAVAQLVRAGTTRFYLGHLSEENNVPLLAYRTSENALLQQGAVLGRDCFLTVNPPENFDSVLRF